MYFFSALPFPTQSQVLDHFKSNHWESLISALAIDTTGLFSSIFHNTFSLIFIECASEHAMTQAKTLSKTLHRSYERPFT